MGWVYMGCSQTLGDWGLGAGTWRAGTLGGNRTDIWLLARSLADRKREKERQRRDKETKRPRNKDKETKRQRDKETKRQRDQDTKRQRDKDTKKQREKDIKIEMRE